VLENVKRRVEGATLRLGRPEVFGHPNDRRLRTSERRIRH